MNLNFFYLLFLTLVFTGCSNSVEKMNNTVKLDKFPKYQVPKKIEKPKPRAKGSLFSNQNNSLFSDRKLLQIGDIINVNIEEGTAAGNNDTQTGGTLLLDQKTNERTLTPVEIARVKTTDTQKGTPSMIESIISGLNGILGIGITGGSGTKKYETASKTTALDILENNIATIVTQEFQNGNYFLEGEKIIVIKGQKIIIRLSGVMNPQDLNTNSEVDSKRLANLKVILYKEGTEAELDEKPWGTKVLDAVVPF